MNDNDFIEYLRQKEYEYLPEPPEGLWRDIEQELRLTNKRQRVVPLWLRYCGVAACIAILFGVGSLLHAPFHKGCQEVEKLAHKANVHVNDCYKTKDQQPLITKLTQRYATKSTITTAAESFANADSTKQESNCTELMPSTQTNASTKERNDNKNAKGHYYHNTNRDFSNPSSFSKQDRTVSLSLYAGNIMSNNAYNQGDYLLADANGTDIEEGDNPYEDIQVLNQGLDVTTKKHYRLPLRAGVRVSIPIGNAIAIESGLTYSLLSSSTESGSEKNYYHTEQTLHYIGIPVKMRYKLWNSARIETYVSGGGMVEKSLSGKAKTTFIIDGNKHGSSTKSVCEKPLQLSASLSAGVEVTMANNASLFIEAGSSYYIDNHSSVDNIYKDKPLNFDFNLGVRINLNK